MKNDPSNKSGSKIIKSCTGKTDYDALQKIIEEASTYKNHLIKLKHYFDEIFNKSKKDKVTIEIEKKLMDTLLQGFYFIITY